MGARNLEARLTPRLLGLAGGLVVLVGAASVGATARMLEESDAKVARAAAESTIDALDAELGEGDALEDGAAEAILAASRAGVLVRLRVSGHDFGDATLPLLRPGDCGAISVHGERWRTCSVGNGGQTAVAAISVGAHRAAIAALAKGMAGIVALALVLMWLAIRQTIRRPLAELAAVVAWTGRILETETPLDPPAVLTAEVAHLEGSFDALVRRLLAALARERASSAHIAHELRTPLTAMAAELEAVRPADASSNGALVRVREDIARFADVIDAILVLSAPQAVAGDPRGRTIVNVADIARELAPAGTHVDAPDEALVEADEPLVRLALRNLLDNARKYGGGARVIRVSHADGRLDLAVADQGPGVDPSARERMFERYWRGTADGDGRGLGLALVRAVAQRHGGSARAEAGLEGRGLAVALELGKVLEWREHPPAFVPGARR